MCIPASTCVGKINYDENTVWNLSDVFQKSNTFGCSASAAPPKLEMIWARHVCRALKSSKIYFKLFFFLCTLQKGLGTCLSLLTETSCNQETAPSVHDEAMKLAS